MKHQHPVHADLKKCIHTPVCCMSLWNYATSCWRSNTRLQTYYSLFILHIYPATIDLIHYLGLRRRDFHPLQERLAAVGLSSLGRMESHVFSNLNAIIDFLSCALGKKLPEDISLPPDTTGMPLLESHTNHLFGRPPTHRRVRMMVMMSSEVAIQVSDCHSFYFRYFFPKLAIGVVSLF